MNRILVLLSLFAVSFSVFAKDIVTPAKQVIERQIGSRVNDIEFKVLPDGDGYDEFSVTAKDGKLTLTADSPVAFCYAFHKYLREACNSMATWSGSNMNIPKEWPEYECEKVKSPYKLRYFFNVCTFGYTMPYWDWKRWEQEIDWMAMRGVNLPLASVASEAIAERVWIKMGLSKESVRKFFTGAAYLPWHRMGNLNSWSGPLTDNWQKDQIALQHKIIDRMRDLGMNPVAPAFAGFVPMEFIEKNPDIQYRHLSWGGFDQSLNAYVLPPESPYFEKIGKMFIEEWENEFGKNKYYLSDSFNEMKLPVDPDDQPAKHKLLAHYGESIYNSIKAGNPDAVWITQGWTFGYQYKFWDEASLQALLSKVPNDKMLIIDLGNDYPKWVWHTEQTWKKRDGFYGKQWIFSYVPNFGGKNLLTGELDLYACSSCEALKAPNKGNLVGFGSAPEGIENNEVVYELLADMGWTSATVDLDSWLESYSKARYGAVPYMIQKAWSLLRRSVYSAHRSYPRFTWQTVVPDKRRFSKVDINENFNEAVECFLSCSDELSKSQLYRNDAIEFASYFIASKADILYSTALAYDEVGKKEEAAKNLVRVVEMLTEVDKLLASHTNMNLEMWVNHAKNSARNAAEEKQYVADAKRLITTWGGFQEDYAARFWSGLIKDYYIPRIKMHLSDDRANLDAWEENWINTEWKNSSVPYDNPIEKAKELVNKYKGINKASFAL